MRCTLSDTECPSMRSTWLGSRVPITKATVRDLRPYTGAGWIVALCGEMMTMPGLGRKPAAIGIDVDAEGRTVGLF